MKANLLLNGVLEKKLFIDFQILICNTTSVKSARAMSTWLFHILIN
jgi:hypothetical protein